MAKRYLIVLLSFGLVMSFCGIGVSDEPVVTPQPPKADEVKQDVSIQEMVITNEWNKDTPLRDILTFISEKIGVTIIADITVDNSVVINQQLAVNKLPWRDVLNEAVRLSDCIVEEVKLNYFQIKRAVWVDMEITSDAPEKRQMDKIINRIADMAGVSIIIARDVEGVTVPKFKFSKVPWMEALEYVCKTSGFVVVKEAHNVYRIIRQEALTSQLETRIFQLQYLRPPTDYRATISVTYALGSAQKPDPAKEFTVLEILQNMLSPNGMLKYDGKTNSIIAKDTKPALDEMEKMVKQLDIEPLQIMFMVNFVNTSNEDLLKFGIDYTTTGETDGWKITSVPKSTSSGSAVDKTRLTRAPFGVGGELEAGSTGTYKAGEFAMGFLSTFDLTSTLRIFSKDAFSKLEQRPFIMTLDGKESTIWVGEKIHYPEVTVTEATAGGATSQVTIKEASKSPAEQGFQLLVVPNIIRGTGKIMLTIIPKNTVLTGAKATTPQGFDTFTVTTAGTANSIDLPRIQESTLVTHLIVQDNQTAVIGGLSTERLGKTITKIPLLGDIPVLGDFLFKYTNDSIRKSYLLIFLTPRIIRNAEESQKALASELEEVKKAEEGMNPDKE
ncbi:MAG: hypothetical protein HY811_07220 [Planctomycetes bacterium]|nr:hypothetical protein [Planctomycetota bacterium]